MVVGRTAVYGAQAGGPDNGSAVLGARESALLRAYQGRLSPWPRGQRPPLRPRVPIASETYMRVPDSDRRIRGAAGRNRLPARLRWEKGGPPHEPGGERPTRSNRAPRGCSDQWTFSGALPNGCLPQSSGSPASFTSPCLGESCRYDTLAALPPVVAKWECHSALAMLRFLKERRPVSRRSRVRAPSLPPDCLIVH